MMMNIMSLPSSSSSLSLFLSEQYYHDDQQQQQQQQQQSSSDSNSDSDSDNSSPKQQLWLCVTLMTLSGLLRVVATMFLAYPDYLKKKKNHQQQQQQNNDNGNGNVNVNSSSASTTTTNTTANTNTSGRNNNNFDRLVLSIKYPILISCHVTFLFVAAMVGIVGSFYGPISIAVPIQTGSQLLFNVVFMGILLQMRSFNKQERTGTYVVFLSVLCLIDVGPGIQNNQNILELLSHKFAIIWSLIITFSLILSTIWTFSNVVYNKQQRQRQQQDEEGGDGDGDGGDEIQEQQYNGDESSYSSNGEGIQQRIMNGGCHNGHNGHHPHHNEYNSNEINQGSDDDNNDNTLSSSSSSSSSTWLTFVILLSGVTLSNVTMATSGKTMGYLNGGKLVLSMSYYVGTSLLGLLFSITSSTKCEQGLFTPASSVALILLNFATGIIIWEDWKVMKTWTSYVCSCLLMCCGVYLLSEFDILEHYYSSKNASTIVDETIDHVLHITTTATTATTQGTSSSSSSSSPSAAAVNNNNNNNNNNNDEIRQPLLLDHCDDDSGIVDTEVGTGTTRKRPQK